MPPDFHGSCILSSFIHEMGTARAATKSEEGGQRERGAEVNFMNFIFFINFNCQFHANQNDLKKRILTRDCQFQAGLWACVLQIVSVKLISVRKFQLTVCVRQHFLGWVT